MIEVELVIRSPGTEEAPADPKDYDPYRHLLFWCGDGWSAAYGDADRWGALDPKEHFWDPDDEAVDEDAYDEYLEHQQISAESFLTYADLPRGCELMRGVGTSNEVVLLTKGGKEQYEW